MKKEKTGRVFISKIIYTFLIIILYAFCRSIPVFGVDVAAYEEVKMDAELLLKQSIGGDIFRYSIMALGISPYMISMIFVQLITVFKTSEAKSRISPKKMNKLTMEFTVILAVCMAVLRVNELKFVDTAYPPELTKIIAAIEMVTGVIVIIWISGRNKRYGIGGQTALILVNILDGIICTLKGHSVREMLVPVALGFGMMIIMLIMENAEKRIPLQRISIQSIFSDKNYQAIKFNPIGVMPIMFASAFFMFPQLVVSVLRMNFPHNVNIAWIEDNLLLTKPLGIAVYIGILYLLTISFSYIFINPKDMNEQFLKSGDSIVNIHPGKDTRRFLSREIILISMFSASVMGLCLGGCMVLQINGQINSSLSMLPSSLMMTTGIWMNLYQEAEAVRNTDSYKAFI